MFDLSSIFNRVNERGLSNAVVVFGGNFYKTLRQTMNTSNVDILAMQMEFPLLAISVTNAFVGLRKPNSQKLMANNTKNAAMAYGIHFESITKGKVTSESYAGKLARNLAEGQGMEYTRIIFEEAPAHQPQKLILHFLQKVHATIPDSEMDRAIEDVASSLSLLLDDLKKAGV